MTKRELIDEIRDVNPSALPEFLCVFDEGDLSRYLDHLRDAQTPRSVGEPEQYERYFAPARPAQAGSAMAVAAAPGVAMVDPQQPDEEPVPTPLFPSGLGAPRQHLADVHDKLAEAIDRLEADLRETAALLS